MLGIRVMMQALGVKRCVVGVERNKPDAIEEMRAPLPSDLDITILPLAREIPAGRGEDAHQGGDRASRCRPASCR